MHAYTTDSDIDITEAITYHRCTSSLELQKQMQEVQSKRKNK